MPKRYSSCVLGGILALIVSGCATWETPAFSPDREHIDQTTNPTTQLYHINAENLARGQTFEQLLNLMPGGWRDEVISAFDRCAGKGQPGPEFAPLVLLAPVATKYVFDLAADALAGYAEDLQNRGYRGYSASLILVGDDAKAVSGTSKVPGCLVLLRTERPTV